MCPGGATCLSAQCCFSDLALSTSYPWVSEISRSWPVTVLYSIFASCLRYLCLKRCKDLFAIYFYVETQTIIYYHLCKCLRETRLSSQRITSCSVTETFRKVNFLSRYWVCDDRIRHCNHLQLLIVLSTKVSNLPLWKLEFSQEHRCHGSVEMTVEDHFNVSRITIARLMIRFRQTCRTNDRPVTTGRVWHHNVKTDI